VNHTDRICVSGLRAYGYHGVLPAERERGQVFIIDAVLCLDTSAAAQTDDLSRTVDYGSLASRLAELVASEPVALLETLAQRLAAACLAEDVVQHAEITVHKPGAPVGVPVRDVSVTIRRSRETEGR
jgi:dihydroneopterin aldolase